MAGPDCSSHHRELAGSICFFPGKAWKNCAVCAWKYLYWLFPCCQKGLQDQHSPAFLILLHPVTQKMYRTSQGEDGLGGSVGWKEDTAYGRGPAHPLLMCFSPFREHRHDTQYRGSSEPALNKHSGENKKGKECRAMYCLF